MTKKATETPQAKDYQAPATGIVLELEYMLFPGRQLTFKSFNAVLKDNQVALEQAAYARYCHRRSIEKNLQEAMAAIDKRNLATDAMAAKIKKQFETLLHQSSCQPLEGILSLLKKAEEKNMRIGLLSFLPEESARQLLARVPLSQSVCLHVVRKDAEDFPTSDSWLSMLKVMKVMPRCAAALVESATACKSALAVGMCCVAVPNQFTAWQSFTGADIVCESVEGLDLNEISALFSMAHFRKSAE